MFHSTLHLSTIESCITTISKTSTMPNISLKNIYPNVVLPINYNNTSINQYHHISTLSNGIKVISEDMIGPGGLIGIFIDSGSRYEQASYRGISNFIEKMAFKSTLTKSSNKLEADFFQVGSNVKVGNQREYMYYAADGLRWSVSNFIELLADIVKNPAFLPSEIEDTKQYFLQEIPLRIKDSNSFMDEIVNKIAYNDKTLGIPVGVTEDALQTINQEKLRIYHKQYFTPNRMVIVGAGVKHSELVDLSNKYFGDMKNSDSSLIKEKSVYTGGSHFSSFDHAEGLTHTTLAWESCNWSSDDLVPTCVLNMLMGGGGSGGPGKGMYSRMYRNVLNRMPSCYFSASSFVPYSDSGLFKFSMQAPAEDSKEMLKIVTAEAVNMTKVKDDEELSRAKAQLQSMIHYNLENRALLFEDLGTQAIATGKRLSPNVLAARIDEVNAAEISRVATKLLSSNLTMVVSGENAQKKSFTYETTQKLLKL